MNRTVELSTPYTDHEHHNTLRHTQTDGQTDDIMITIADHNG